MQKPEIQLSRLSLEEKARLCVGMNFWMTQDYPEYDIPSLFMSDGPHGLRKQDVEKSDHLGINESHPSVCYPTASAAACTWDRDLLRRMGCVLGREAAQSGVDILLGPGINIKRSPLCGRNFEYYSEDPCLAGELAAAMVEGIQSAPAAACVKHFAANSQENRRKAVDAVMDERTLREIYLAAFETVVKKGGVKAVMTSYNKVNGDYPAQNPHLSRDILRQEWGFDGILLTDWGAMDQIVPSLQAGLSLQMPGNDGSSVRKLVKSVEDGRLKEECLDGAVLSILRVIRSLRETPAAEPISPEEGHAFAAEVAKNAVVLLKNEDSILPLGENDRIAVIGEMAAEPRYQGGGSSHVNPYRVSSALEEMKKLCPGLVYAPGYSGAETNEALLEQARAAAASCHTVVAFIGLPESFESETYDRTSLDIPPAYVRLVEELAAVNPRLAVVLSNGSVISMPWLPRAKAVVEAYLCGEAGGEAVSSILFGRTNPSGKLAETFVGRIEDSPAYLYTPSGEDRSDRCEYREGIFVGYRYYEKKKIDPVFPFGHGLSYTQFAYTQLRLNRKELSDGEELEVSCRVTNTGRVAGREIVQVYVGRVDSLVPAPVKELREFSKIHLEPGETKEVAFRLGKRAFAYYNMALGDYYVPDGQYQILVGASSADIRLWDTVRVRPEKPWQPEVTRNTILRDILESPQWSAIFSEKYAQIQPYLPFGLDKMDLEREPFARALLNNMTLHSLASYVGEHLRDEEIDALVDQMNRAAGRS